MKKKNENEDESGFWWGCVSAAISGALNSTLAYVGEAMKEKKSRPLRRRPQPRKREEKEHAN